MAKTYPACQPNQWGKAGRLARYLADMEETVGIGAAPHVVAWQGSSGPVQQKVVQGAYSDPRVRTNPYQGCRQ